MWYKWAQKQVSEWEIPPDQWGISKKQVENMINRIKALSKNYYLQQGIKWEDVSDEDLALEAENNFEIYNRYLANLPEDIFAYDVIKAYRLGLLPENINLSSAKPLDISNSPEIETQNLPWEPKKYQTLDKEELRKILEIAKTRITPTNKNIIEKARYQIFIASFKDPEILNKLEIKQSELNKLIRSWSNMPAKSLELEKKINEATSLTTEWTGISNSAYLSIINIDHQDIDGFFKEIKIDPNISEWYQKQAEPLRKYILRTTLAIDTHIKYNDLSFEIVNIISSFKNPRGIYIPRNKTIQIKENLPNTVAHEIGHYLDYKWADDLSKTNSSIAPLSEAIFNEELVFGDDQEAKQFYHFFQEFIMRISEKSNISSEYLQKRSEVFARFVAQFVDWVNKKSGAWYNNDSYYNDNFTEYDFIQFIKILQIRCQESLRL